MQMKPLARQVPVGIKFPPGYDAYLPRDSPEPGSERERVPTVRRLAHAHRLASVTQSQPISVLTRGVSQTRELVLRRSTACELPPVEKSCSCGARDKHHSDAVDACGEIGNDLQACNAHDWCQIEGMSQSPLHPLANSSILVLPHYRNSGLRRDSVYCNDRHAYGSGFGA